jgi:hypothetical protein
MLKNVLIDQLRTRRAKPGEKVEAGWHVFRVVEGKSGIDLETLDFQEMASFTRDFRIAEQIHEEQSRVLKEAGAQAERCTVRHFANVDTSFEPGHADVFMSRVAPAKRDDSGWVVGMRADKLRVNDLSSHDAMSLYEISLQDRRLISYWLLPVGWSVVFEDNAPVVVPPGKSDRYFETDTTVRPWWKFW